MQGLFVGTHQTKGGRWLRRSTAALVIRNFIVAAFAAVAIGWGLTQAIANPELKFVKFVKFKPQSHAAKLAGAEGDLTINVVNSKDGELVRLALSNLDVGGAAGSVSLQTTAFRKDFGLKQSILRDEAKGVTLSSMIRQEATSALDNQKADVFIYKEMKDGGGPGTQSEPYVEYKVVDFISVILVAADAVHRKLAEPVNLSMLRDRAVTRVVLEIEGEEAVAGRPGTRVRVSAPGDTTGGVKFIISRTDDGSYYPALIRLTAKGVLVELVGSP